MFLAGEATVSQSALSHVSGTPGHSPSDPVDLGNLAWLENGVRNATERGADIEREDKGANGACVWLASTRGGLHGGRSRGGEISRPAEEEKITDKAEPRGRGGDFKERAEGDGRKKYKEGADHEGP